MRAFESDLAMAIEIFKETPAVIYIFVLVVQFLVLYNLAYNIKHKNLGHSICYFVIYWVTVICVFLGFNDEMERKKNIVSCNKLGIVEEVVCTSEMTKEKNSRNVAKCRVLLNDGSKHNLDQDLLAIKGDKISFCTNSYERLNHRNGYIVE